MKILVINQSISVWVRSCHQLCRHCPQISFISRDTNKQLSLHFNTSYLVAMNDRNSHTSRRTIGGQSVSQDSQVTASNGPKTSMNSRSDCREKSDTKYMSYNGSHGLPPIRAHSSHLRDMRFNMGYNSGQYYSMATNPYYGYPSHQPYYGFAAHTAYGSSHDSNCHNYSDPSPRSEKCKQTLTIDEIRRKVSKFRPFIKTNDSNSRTNGFKFSIMSYNILSQNLLNEHKYLYHHCEPTHIEWPQRGQLIVNELLESDADILCLQEVHSQHFRELIGPELQKYGYNFVYEKRTGNLMDGCVIAYKENMFSLLKSTKLELKRKDLSSLLDRDHIGLIVELRPKSLKSKSKLFVANTHLLYNPKRGDVKITQLRLLLAELDRLALISANENAFEYNPIILCGDLNSEPQSLLPNFITTGALNLKGYTVGDISGQRNSYGKGNALENCNLELSGITSDSRYSSSSSESSAEDGNTDKMSIKHNFKLRSIFSDVSNDRNPADKWVSTSNRFESSLVDYIFYDYKKLKLLGFHQLMTANQMNEIENIPNAYLGSDHLSIKAKFLMN